MTKKTAQSSAESVLQAFLSEAAERFKPDATVLTTRIETAVQRYTASSTTQRFHAAAPLAIQQLRRGYWKAGDTISASHSPFTLPVRGI